MAKLGVNIDHIATLREVRRAKYPDPIAAALMAELAGADNITCHLREDRRHIQDRDVRLLRETIQTELNLEMAATLEMTKIALEIKPDTVTLVPEHREELTTEGGLDLSAATDPMSRAIVSLKEAGIVVSLFIDPDTDAVKMAHRLGAHAVEIHTGKYAHAERKGERERELVRIADAVQFAHKLKLGVHAGHGLHYQNILPLTAIPQIESFQIGHAIVAQAMMIGFGKAVAQMKSII